MVLILMFTQIRYCNLYHPNREDEDDMTIYDAEFMADVMKRVEEMRHDMAIKCVQLGVYPNVVKAKEQARQQNYERSQYKFKHLLYRYGNEK